MPHRTPLQFAVILCLTLLPVTSLSRAQDALNTSGVVALVREFCVDCHGGDGSTRNKVQAHVTRQGDPIDERVAPLDENLSWRRFRNPMDLRVVDRTCGTCHEQEVEWLSAINVNWGLV